MNASSRALVCSEQCSTERKRIWQLEYRAANYSAIREKKIRRYAENSDAERDPTANATPRLIAERRSATSDRNRKRRLENIDACRVANSNIAPKTPEVLREQRRKFSARHPMPSASTGARLAPGTPRHIAVTAVKAHRIENRTRYSSRTRWA